MKTLISSLLLFSVTATCALCDVPLQQGVAQHDTSFEKIKEALESGQDVGKSVPYVLRPFEPYRDGKWIGDAIAYGGYRKGQTPGHNGPSKAEILEDLSIITKYWNFIRIYGADDDAERILQVIQEYNLPVKVMVGVWLEDEANAPLHKRANIAQALRGIVLAHRYPNSVAAVSVGNETQVSWSGHRMPPEVLIRYVRGVRKYTDVPVTTADDYNFWNKPESKQVADEVDFVFTHAHPMWNGQTLENAIEWLDKVYRALQQIHSERVVVIGETGWATTYNPDKRGAGEQGALVKGEVSVHAQEQFLIKLHQWVTKNKITTFLFEAFDESWKGGGDSSGPDEVEKHWGVFHERRTPKESFQHYLKHIETTPD
jgi:exo-beta-1,3-glucanase (GH17 family)